MTGAALLAQLPPSLYRVEKFDTAVDGPAAPTADGSAPAPVSEAFGRSLDAKRFPLRLAGSPSLGARPLTVSLWAKLDSANSFNILLAHEPKSSPRHWEFYTFAGTGRLALYLPGNPSGDTLQSAESVTDGKWHWLGLILDKDSAELFIDGVSAAKGKIDRPESETPEGTVFGIGTLAEGSLGCDGAIDEVRIISGLPEKPFTPESVPAAPLASDERTILLAHFDEAVPTADGTPNGDALIAPRREKAASDDFLSFDELSFPSVSVSFALEGTLAEKNQGAIKIGADRVEQLFPTGGVEPTVKPGEKPAKNIPTRKIERAAFDARANALGVASVGADDFRNGVFAHWGERFVELEDQISGKTPLPRGAAEQAYDAESLIAAGERFPVEVVLRRTKAVLDSLENGADENDEQFKKEIAPLAADLKTLQKAVDKELSEKSPNAERLADDYFLAAALRRKLMFLNPELESLDRILFLARACYAGSRLTNPTNSDRTGGHFATQVYGFNSIHGGGLFALADWRAKNPSIQNLLADKKVTATPVCSRLAGKELDYGSFYAPEVDYDGRTIYFSHTGSREHRWIWTPDTTWNLFRLTLDGEGKPAVLTQLTDSAYNDFDVCALPNGRLVFASERRGGFIRCFAEGAALRVTTSVLHSMKPDGTDIYPISFFETSEWQPSVDHGGMLVYTRWDYTDRENCLGSTYWTCAPDGRNPRSPHGNYPFPWFTFEDNKHGDHRFGTCPDAPSGLPMTEMQFRAIPNSHRYIFTAAPHHGETFGSICVLDLRVENDNHMSQVRRVTPYFPFPESESPARHQYRYGSPWPVNEDLFLCNSWEDLILLDRFGNEELLCEREILPIGYDPRLRLSEPIPLAARERPAVIPQQTAQGEDFAGKETTATIGVVNVNIADLPLPKDRPVKRLRVLQVIPKPNPWMDTPWIGYATENTPRIPLGTVPVEPDGSAYFEAPSGKQLLFQILDENNMAIQTMRAVAFVHPGEKLICTGCHEPVAQSVENVSAQPSAFTRAPSKLEPECGPIEPINFYRLVQPVFEKSCIPCHVEKEKGPTAMGFEEMRPWVYYYSGSMQGGTLRTGTHGGSRSRPGRVGASESKLGKILFDENHLQTVSDEDRHKLILWLDANALRLGAFQNEEAQKRGELVWPLLDASPEDAAYNIPFHKPEKSE